MKGRQKKDADPQRELSGDEIEDREFNNFKIKGAIILSEFRDTFEYYPREGYEGTGSLASQTRIDLWARELEEADRKIQNFIQYYRDGELYYARVFARVQRGMHIK